jgi:hypothetical protein
LSGYRNDFPSKNSIGDCVHGETNAKLTRKTTTKEELTFWRFSFLFDENLSWNRNENRLEFEEYSGWNPPEFYSRFPVVLRLVGLQHPAGVFHPTEPRHPAENYSKNP